MAACSLAIITASFPPGPKLHRAIAIVGGDERPRRRRRACCSAGSSPKSLSWRWVLLINPPIAIAAALVAYAVVTERRRARGEAPASTSRAR